MRKEMQTMPQSTERTEGAPFPSRGAIFEDSTMLLITFVERKFIPSHVEFKSLAGRMHYQAILKHILRPESVDRLFAPYVGLVKARLRAVPDWPYLDHVRLCDLNADHVRKLTLSAFARGYSAQTVKHIRNVISAILSHARRERMFSGENPLTAVKLPPIIRKKPHDLTVIQAKAILRMLEYPEREIALVSMTTGMSITEICSLQWKHINLSRTTIAIDGELIPPGAILVRKHRNGAGVMDASGDRVRVVPVPAPLIRALVRLNRSRSIADPNGFIIAAQKGDPVRPATARMLRLKPIGRELQMPWLSWRVLKQAHDSLLSELRLQLTDDLVLCVR